METTKLTYECPACNKQTSDCNGAGVCDPCAEDGYWVDPAGGLHYDDPNNPDNWEDPAAMYE